MSLQRQEKSLYIRHTSPRSGDNDLQSTMTRIQQTRRRPLAIRHDSGNNRRTALSLPFIDIKVRGFTLLYYSTQTTTGHQTSIGKHQEDVNHSQSYMYIHLDQDYGVSHRMWVSLCSNLSVCLSVWLLALFITFIFPHRS